MAELLLELYSEEIPPQLQIAARSQIKQFIENSFEEDSIKYKELLVYSSPTRLMVFIKNLAEKIKIEAKTHLQNACCKGGKSSANIRAVIELPAQNVMVSNK